MTDKELLELAAKAAGIEIYTQIDNAILYQVGKYLGHWSPLTDDGDALRLAVKLKIEPHFVGESVHAVILQGTDVGEWEQVLAEELIANDPYAATRRAIVRAAAEIGKSA